MARAASRKAPPGAVDSPAELARVFKALRQSVGAVMGRALSNEAIMVEGKIAAFISNGRLVVKLPPQRVEEMLESGDATRMRMGNRAMKEWISVPAAARERWIELAEESARYVRSTAARTRKAKR